MKLVVFVVSLILGNSAFSAPDMKEMLLKAAKDKKNQEQAKEIAQKGVEYIKGQKKEEAAQPAVVPVPTTTPPTDKDQVPMKKAIKKKNAKKKTI